MRRLLVSIIGAGISLLLAASPALADYTVKRGDTLSHIAAAHDTSWPELYEANRAIIDDPDLIYPGQVLVIDTGPKVRSSQDLGRSSSEPKPRDVSADAAQPATVRPATGGVTSPYGMRTHPITGVYKLHTGTDYAVGDGKAYAAKAGRVSAVTYDAAYGNMVTIDHGGGTVSRYAHLASVAVADGAKVSAGTVVGRIGSTGYSTGAHLHFEVLKNGEFINPVSWL